MKGLVLIGGKSSRMGESKGALVYHNIEQQYYLYHLLEQFCTSVHLSCRAEQLVDLSANYNCIIDKYENIGPLNGLLSAFEEASDEAWLIVACDMPYVTAENLSYLIQQRIKEKIATVFEYEGRVEPLLGIWEVSSFLYLKAAFNKNRYSLRRILEENNVNLLKPKTAKTVSNINTKAAYLKVLKEL